MSSTEASNLLVDDESHVIAALTRHFTKDAFQVFTATSAADAYDILGRR